MTSVDNFVNERLRKNHNIVRLIELFFSHLELGHKFCGFNQNNHTVIVFTNHHFQVGVSLCSAFYQCLLEPVSSTLQLVMMGCQPPLLFSYQHLQCLSSTSSLLCPWSLQFSFSRNFHCPHHEPKNAIGQGSWTRYILIKNCIIQNATLLIVAGHDGRTHCSLLFVI